ncbi:hypothetical protein GCM10011416_03030 [Polaribacter pacificus]|uniref:BioF2-like acetyltransferase domain-containing protein n=1 Tax=Polaribacter pacificus TaxID=1775173 RepID=A0A917HTU9_9FLAO|nr:GNAT family N-acetyltransferase [Polaribacter pacificus]GGG89888.1 hypothetical protein GCM10011416_03030 [Polaribacter pacificus]
MIRYVNRAQLDDEKYNNCIRNSVQSRVYAYSWYLDCVCEQWGVLVLDDYTAVMPLPWKRKFGLAVISQPFFTQQLGVFSFSDLSEDDFSSFVKAIPKRFVKVSLQLNSLNDFCQKKCVAKTNYIISLNKPYVNLYKEYNKGRKHALNKGLKQNLVLEPIQFDELIQLAKTHYQYPELKEKDFENLAKLVATLAKKSKVSILGLYEQEQLIGGSVFVIHDHRITYLFSAMHPKGKQQQVPTLLIDNLIKNHSETAFIFDFEGSMIPTIASFFKSFGAQKETYFLFKKSLL